MSHYIINVTAPWLRKTERRLSRIRNQNGGKFGKFFSFYKLYFKTRFVQISVFRQKPIYGSMSMTKCNTQQKKIKSSKLHASIQNCNSMATSK